MSKKDLPMLKSTDLLAGYEILHKGMLSDTKIKTLTHIPTGAKATGTMGTPHIKLREKLRELVQECFDDN